MPFTDTLVPAIIATWPVWAFLGTLAFALLVESFVRHRRYVREERARNMQYKDWLKLSQYLNSKQS